MERTGSEEVAEEIIELDEDMPLEARLNLETISEKEESEKEDLRMATDVTERKEETVKEKEVKEENKYEGSVGSKEGDELLDFGAVRKRARKVRDLLDKLEDEGADRKTVRKIRRYMEDIAESAVGWREKRRSEDFKDSVSEGSERSMKHRKMNEDIGREREESIGEEVSRREGREREARPLDRGELYVVEIAEMEVNTDDLLIQVYDCPIGLKPEIILQAMLTEEVRNAGFEVLEVGKWALIKKLKYASEVLATFVFKVPGGAYIALLNREERKLRVRGKEVKYGPYV